MEANKSDCEKCIRIAQSAIASEDFEKANKFLLKAQKLYPSELVNNLLKDVAERENNPKSFKSDNKYEENDTNSSKTNKDNTRSRKPNNTQEEKSSDQSDALKKIKNCRDFYEILGVPKTATEADLKKAYKKLALQFHPDKNKSSGATEAFKAIGKAFAVLSDAQKRKQYDSYGPESFDGSESSSHETNRHRHQQGQYHSYWNEEDFSADELFNLFFGGGGAYTASSTNRRRHANHTHAAPNGQANFTFSSSLMPILLILILSLLSNFMIGEPVYNLQKTNKYSIKRTTTDHHVSYFVKPDFKVENLNELKKIERQAEEDLHIELRQSCFREKSYKETAIWRARNYGDERLLKKAHEYETPSCTKINHIFGGG